MKKILLATTLLATSAGFASADVAVSGSARMGIVQSRVTVGETSSVETQFTSRVRINFNASGTTDGGLSFGASVRNDQMGNGGTANGDSTVFISGAFGKLTFGDVAGGAADNLVGQVSGVGFTSLGSSNEIGYLSGTATAVRYDYTTGALSVSVGVQQTTAPAGADRMSLAVKYAAGNYNVAVGYESQTAASVGAATSLISVKGATTFGAATVTVKYARANTNASEIGASLDYAVSPALTLTAFVTDHSNNGGYVAKGLGASYDLGGGAKVVGGVVNNGVDTLADVGVTMSF